MENTTNSAASGRRSARSTTDCESDSNDEHDDSEENPKDVEDLTELFENLRQEETEDDIDGNPESTLFLMIKQMQLNFQEVEAGFGAAVEGPCEHNGPTGLKPGIAASFADPLECLAVSGLDCSFVARLARNSNEHTRKFILPKDRNRRLHSHDWKNVNVSEMHVFLGITLRMSLSPMDSGGHAACFRKQNKHVCGKLIFGTKGFAHKHMKMRCHKQI